MDRMDVCDPPHIQTKDDLLLYFRNSVFRIFDTLGDVTNSSDEDEDSDEESQPKPHLSAYTMFLSTKLKELAITEKAKPPKDRMFIAVAAWREQQQQQHDDVDE